MAGKTSVINSDKVRLAYEQANDDEDYPSRRRLAELLGEEVEKEGLRVVVDEPDASGRSLSESGSGDPVADEDAPERSRDAGGRLTMFVYLAKAGVDDVLTAPILKQMCEVENVILGAQDYGKVCYNASSDANERTSDPSGSQCTLPSNSIVALFYMLWDTSVHNVADVQAAMAKVQSSLALLNATLDSTTNLPVWWADAANAAAIANFKASVEAASAAASPLNPGGTTVRRFRLITAIDSYVPMLTTRRRCRARRCPSLVTLGPLPPSLYSLLTSLDKFLGGTGNLDRRCSTVDRLRRRLSRAPTKAPVSESTPTVASRTSVTAVSWTQTTKSRRGSSDLAHGSSAMRNASASSSAPTRCRPTRPRSRAV